jgi:flagellar biosynthesis protein FlhG
MLSVPNERGAAPAIWSIGGGKGGVGKSFVAANLAVRLAQLGRRVVIVDGDLGGANLDAIFGCNRPPHTLAHFFARQVAKLDDLRVSTGVERLSLVAGDAEVLGSGNPQHAQKLKLIRHLRRLDCDVVIIDLGAGTTFNTLDLWLAADLQLVVATPEPTAVQNCFAFIKAATLRDLERRTGVERRGIDHASLRRLVMESDGARAALTRTTRLVVNRATAAEGRRVTNVLHDLAGRFLGGGVQLLGIVHDDRSVATSIRNMVPLLVDNPAAPAAVDVASLATALVEPAANQPPTRPTLGVNEEVLVAGQVLHLQTEDLGSVQSAVRTQIFGGDGRVLWSRRTPYMDAFFQRLQVAPPQRVRFHHMAIRKALTDGRIDFGAEPRKSA